MSRRAARAAIVATGMLFAGPAATAPADPPPRGYEAATYVDARGCIWHRARIGQAVAWAALVEADGAQRCGALEGAPDPGTMPPHRSGTAPPFPAPGRYAQIGLFRDLARAEVYQRQLRAAGLPLLLQDFRRGGGRVQRVLYAGPYADRGEAEAALAVIQGLGFADAFLRAAAP